MSVLLGGEDHPNAVPQDFKYYCTVFGIKVYRKMDGPFAGGEYWVLPDIKQDKRDAVERYMVNEGLIIGDEFLFLKYTGDDFKPAK